jgi:acylphosphatase
MENELLNRRVHLRIRGKVQGVYYRSSASEEARVLGLRGFVRNLPTGEVELIAEGAKPALDKLVAWCQVGPPAAEVSEVAVHHEAATGEYPDFRVRRGDPLL